MRFGAARKKIPALVEALDSTFTEDHAFMCRYYLDQVGHLNVVVSVLGGPCQGQTLAMRAGRAVER